MGQIALKISQFPVKTNPVCYYRQESFTSTGEEKPNYNNFEENDEFDKIQSKFVTKLIEIKAMNRNSGHQIDASAYPGWDSVTLENLQSIFLLVTEEENVGQMNFNQFCVCLDSLCNKTPRTFRRDKFLIFDDFNTGFINFQQFVQLIYTFNSANINEIGIGELKGVARTCRDLSNYIQFVESLSLGCQLQNGLF